MGMGRFSIREKLIPKVPLILYLVLAVDGSLVQGYIRRVVEDETEDNGVSRFVNIIIERETATGAPSNDPFTDPTEVPTIGNSQTSSSPRPSQGPFHTPSLRISSHHPTSSPLSEPTLVPLRPNGTVNFVGDGGAINALLDRCQGDCDSDNDCSEGLSCFQRTAMDDPFPGCNGTMLDDLLYTDVCINLMDLPSASPTMSKMPSTSPTATPSGTPIAEPTWFPTRQPIVQPSAAPAEKPSMVPTRVLGFAVRVGNDFGPGLPLKNCQGKLSVPILYCYFLVLFHLSACAHFIFFSAGDCDSDSDCEFDLLCWRRNSATDPLPGCIGSLDDDTDICVERNFLPTVSPTIRPTPRPTFGPGITFKIRMYWNHYFWQEVSSTIYVVLLYSYFSRPACACLTII